jgi:hypothetical protein
MTVSSSNGTRSWRTPSRSYNARTASGRLPSSPVHLNEPVPRQICLLAQHDLEGIYAEEEHPRLKDYEHWM